AISAWFEERAAMTARISVFLILVSMATPAGAGLALVGNENGGTISLIDTARDEVVGEIKTGGKPRGAAIHASRKLAYVSDQPNKDRKSTRLNSSHVAISYAGLCLKKKKMEQTAACEVKNGGVNGR